MGYGQINDLPIISIIAFEISGSRTVTLVLEINGRTLYGYTLKNNLGIL